MLIFKAVVGKCDKGPLTYTVHKSEDQKHTVVQPTFFTTAIGVQPPSCEIMWDSSYVDPTEPTIDQSPLPGCFMNDSQEA